MSDYVAVAKLAAIDFAVQWGAFVFAALFQSDKYFDLTGSLTFIGLAYQSRQWSATSHLRQSLHTGAVMTWAARLGLYLFTRILKAGHDRRLDTIKTNPVNFFGLWTIQGVWILVTLLPLLLLNNNPRNEPIGARDYIGGSMWVTGFILESLADWQKSQFRNNPDNAGRFIKSGVWAWSRHPNYLGEILMSGGLYVSASTVMRGWEYLSIVSPIFITFLLTKVSGIPMLEKEAHKRWGTDADYLAYVRDTAVLIPFIY